MLSKKLIFAVVFTAALFYPAGTAFTAQLPDWITAAEVAKTRSILDEPIVNNKYILESIRASNLSRQAFADGDYDLSISFSGDAMRAAALSDEFIMMRLKIERTNEKIGEAEQRLGWADSSKARKYYVKEFNDAKALYNQALLSRTAGEWDGALNNALASVEALSHVVAPPSSGADAKNSGGSESGVLPAQYTVRQWDAFGDCFWNIAGRSWVYNNPYQWPILYRANREKLVDPQNPNLIAPGTVLDIPSIRGEKRGGMWDSGKKYSPLR